MPDRPPSSPPDPFELLTGGAELLDCIEPLWLQLRQHHAELAPRWSASLMGKSFESRRAELVAKARRGMLVAIATCGDEKVGYCVGTIVDDGSGEVDSLFVNSAHRGRGVGDALMTRATDWFTGRGVRTIALDVIDGNDAALRFYARFGFAARTVRLVREGD